MAKEEYDYELRKIHNEILKNEVECTIADGRTELEKSQEKTIQNLIEENNKLKIENNLMRELLSRPVTYTYGVR